MNEILEKTRLSNEVYKIKVYAPLIAQERLPGQFIILQVINDLGERTPLTINDADTEAGTITLIFQTVGSTTHYLANLNVGDSILHLVGPLGNATHIEKIGTIVCVGGGIGVAPLYPISQGMKKAGNNVISIIGARTKELILLENEMQNISDELILCTDDGSYGKKCLVTEPLKEICERKIKPDLVIAIGPPVMMKYCSLVTKEYSIPTIVSLNSIMLDGTGMCGGCRVTVGEQTKFTCVDGPEFDGHLVDFDNLIQRLNTYKKQEDNEHHKCHLDLNVKE